MQRSPVDIWTVSLGALHVNYLSPDEKARAARFHFEQDRLHWIAARSALRLVLSRYLAVPPGEISFVLGTHGKPAVENSAVQFNLSHSRGWGMIAVSRDTPVGVDLEEIRDRVDMAKLLMRIDEKDLPTEKPALFQRWTEREARTKAAGSPLMKQPDPNIYTVPLAAPPNFAAAVALIDAIPEPVYCGGNL